MTDSRIIAVFASALVIAGSSTAMAQRWGRGDLPREGVCFYKDADYRGEYFCARAGESIAAMPGDMNDQISSIRIFGNAEVMVYRDDGFRGNAVRLNGDVRNLQDQGWNDRISSVQVRGGYYGRAPANEPVFPVSRERDRFPGSQDPDRIVRRAYEDILHREPDPEGMRTFRSRIIDDRWTEEQVREALRNSPEYRDMNTMSVPRAQEIVRQAYLSVLRREPDPASQTWVTKVLREHWTQQDVERELRKSPEYRNRPR